MEKAFKQTERVT
jgi:hypothetical protein